MGEKLFKKEDENDDDNDSIQIGKKCNHYKVQTQTGFENCQSDQIELFEKNIPNEALHGDMIIIGEKKLRSMNVYFVCCNLTTNEENEKVIKKNLCQKDPSSAGYCCVPLEVTRKIKDPIKFYEDAFTFDNYDEIDFSGIEIDTIQHQDIIMKYTDGKHVDPSRKCFYFLSYNEWDSSSGMFIWCDFFLDDFDSGRYLKLTSDINETYLVRSPQKIRDNQILASSIEMKSKYEEKFTNLFMSMEKGTEVEVYGLTFFCPKSNDLNGGSVLTMMFNRIEKDDDTIHDKIISDSRDIDKNNSRNINNNIKGIKSIVLNRNSDETSNEEFHFTKKILTEYGRFGNVKLWCIENASIMDDLHTYVICSSDLFL